jgi:D-alanyl-D-alanine carboxypeptidase (penicillin-binding protein 5/6)
LITALTVLSVKPLSPGEQGPTLTLGPADVALYNSYHSQDGSLVKVQNGEKISEYQVLQTLMLPSSNNMADSLAIWAFGSLKNYQQSANQFLEDNGLVESHVGKDASGFDPSTTSTAEDLARIGELVMQNPVLAQIVGQSSASGIPVAGTIKNVNQLLGYDNIVGIKTGNTDQAGGVYVSASKVTVNGKPVTIVTALAGAPGLWEAMHDSLPLIRSAQTNFKPVTAVAENSPVATYSQPWGGNVSAVAAKSIKFDAWGGSTIQAQARLNKISSDDKAGQIVGSVTVPKSAYNDQLSASVKLQSSPAKSTIWWRLTHPF